MSTTQATPHANPSDQARSLGHAVYLTAEDTTAAALDQITDYLRDGNRLALIDAANLLDGAAERIRALHSITGPS